MLLFYCTEIGTHQSMLWINVSSGSLCPEPLTVLMNKSKKEKQSKETKVISWRSYGESGPEQNWGLLILRPPG